MTDTAVGHLSRISFFTDMTRAEAPVLPLGFMLEAAWPDQARWLGLIGRTSLTRAELDCVNLTTWPELRAPFDLLDGLFDKGWEAKWGHADEAIRSEWSRSAFAIHTDQHPLSTLSAETAEAWTSTCDVLCTQLNALRVRLVPSLVARQLEFRRRAPIITRPIDFRMRVGAPPEATAA
jgi:hypothetical protein